GSIPLIGALFRVRKTDKIKTNLMIFIRATILRDSTQTALQTNAKYNFIRDFQRAQQDRGVQLMPNEQRPILPPLEEASNADSSAAVEE
ncbi:MAG: type II secretion system protein GspD, partial [Gammaproteobacteria bacterium]